MMTRAISVLYASLLAFLLISCSSAKQEDPRGISPVTSILVQKGRRRLHLKSQGKILKSYRIALGKNPIGPKQFEGDGRTPEGRYLIDGRNPSSAFHLSLHVSYPSQADIERARAMGRHPGKDIMIHGIANGRGWIGRLHNLKDWTDGCIAVTDDEIEEIWASVNDGTPIEIEP